MQHSIAELFNNNLDNGKISDIKRIRNRWGDILPKEYRKEIQTKLYKIKNKKNLSELEKEEINDDLTELVRILDKKEKYHQYDRDDHDYYGIRDIENLFVKVDEEDYYKPILVKSSFKKNYVVYESRGDKERYLSVEQYLDGIKPYLRDLINSHKNKEWKIQLNMYINFLSFKDAGETRFIYIWSDNEEIRWGNETDDVIDNLFESLLDNYQKEQQIMRGGSNFSFESVELLQYSLHKIKLKRGGSYMDPLEWIRNKLATINPKNYDDNNFFQYAITVALNHQNIENHPERISNIESFIDKYNWEGINFSVHQKGQKDWKVRKK